MLCYLILAYITHYSAPPNALNAMGKHPRIGTVAVSDRNIPLGSEIELDGKSYLVADRTAKWVQKRQGLTVDVFTTDTVEQMLAFGKRRALVGIIQ